MNTLNLTCALLLTLLSSITLFASLVKLFFTSDELKEMGVRLETPEMQADNATYWISSGIHHVHYPAG